MLTLTAKALDIDLDRFHLACPACVMCSSSFAEMLAQQGYLSLKLVVYRGEVVIFEVECLLLQYERNLLWMIVRLRETRTLL